MPRRAPGQRQPDLLLLMGWEEVDDAADRLLRVDRVQGGQDQVSGLSGAQSGMHRLRVAHLADQDDVGSCRIAERIATLKSAVSIRTSRWLIRARLSWWMISIGVLDRHNVDVAVPVDLIDHAGGWWSYPIRSDRVTRIRPRGCRDSA